MTLLIVILLFILYAFFSAAEMAIISLNDGDVRRAAEQGDRHATRLQTIMSEPGRFLATIYAGRSLVGIAAAGYFTARTLPRIFHVFGLASTAGKIGVGAALFFCFVFFLLVVGDQLPRRIAQEKPERSTRWLLPPYRFFAFLLNPLVSLATIVTNLVLRIIGIDPIRSDRVVTEEELRMMLDASSESGNIHEEERTFIENIFELDDKNVAECMTHRTDIAALPVDATLDEVLKVIREEQFTRLPVYEEHIDRIIGIFNTKDLFYC